MSLERFRTHLVGYRSRGVVVLGFLVCNGVGIGLPFLGALHRCCATCLVRLPVATGSAPCSLCRGFELFVVVFVLWVHVGRRGVGSGFRSSPWPGPVCSVVREPNVRFHCSLALRSTIAALGHVWGTGQKASGNREPAREHMRQQQVNMCLQGQCCMIPPSCTCAKQSPRLGADGRYCLHATCSLI